MHKIAIADDSILMRNMLKDVLESTGSLNVVAAAKNGREAIDVVKQHQPEMLILDCEMPIMTGLEALQVIMKENPIPVLMFSSLTKEGATVTIQALEYGAVDFLLKPSTGVGTGLKEVSDQLIKKITSVVTKSNLRRTFSKPSTPIQTTKSTVLPSSRNIDIIAIGSSTGGVQAAIEVVSRLPAHLPPIVWVQHMPPKFTASFATRLDQVSKLNIKEAEDGDILQKGTCYLAPGGYQMKVVSGPSGAKLEIGGEQKVSGYCPSCDVLFESVSKLYSKNALGVILTGMGKDGTQGLQKMHDKGSYVIGQDESSCVVYGMPRSAFEAGVVDMQMDIKQVAEGITKCV